MSKKTLADGRGVITDYQDPGLFKSESTLFVTCPVCHGERTVVKLTEGENGGRTELSCRTCEGRGLVEQV